MKDLKLYNGNSKNNGFISVEDIDKMVENNYYKPDFCVNWLMDHFHCCKDKLYNIWYKQYNIPIKKAIELKRMHFTITLLNSREPLIWKKVGYTNISVFSRTFKRIFKINYTQAYQLIHNSSKEESERVKAELLKILIDNYKDKTSRHNDKPIDQAKKSS